MFCKRNLKESQTRRNEILRSDETIEIFGVNARCRVWRTPGTARPLLPLMDLKHITLDKTITHSNSEVVGRQHFSGPVLIQHLILLRIEKQTSAWNTTAHRHQGAHTLIIFSGHPHKIAVTSYFSIPCLMMDVISWKNEALLDY